MTSPDAVPSAAVPADAVAGPPAAPAPDLAAYRDVVETLRGRTFVVRFTVHGLPKSRRLTGKLADQVAQAVKGTRRGVRSSWGLFTAEHPAVQAVNAAVRAVERLRDDWTIVLAAEPSASRARPGAVAPGMRLIWDKDVSEFYSLFQQRAWVLDECVRRLQHALDHATTDEAGRTVPSVKEMDRQHAGEAWSPAAYPEDLRSVVGVAKEIGPDGAPLLDKDGRPVYAISFSEFQVSEKLPALLRERALARLDECLASTVEAATRAVVSELSDQLMTLLEELSERTRVYPPEDGPYGHLYGADVLRKVTHDQDRQVPPGHVRVLLRYRPSAGPAAADGGDGAEVVYQASCWLGPLPNDEFVERLRPHTTAERRRLYPSVVEGIISAIETFRDKKARMLGRYGQSLVEAVTPLLERLTEARRHDPLLGTTALARTLTEAVRKDRAARDRLSALVSETVGAVAEKLEDVRAAGSAYRRRTVRELQLPDGHV